MDNLTKQADEIEALKSIYDKEFQVEDEKNKVYSIKIGNDCNSNVYVKLYVKFPDTYPTMSPPTFEISAPHLKKDKKTHLSLLLDKVYLSHVGQNVIFQWIEKIREELQSINLEQFYEIKDEDITVEESNISNSETNTKSEFQCSLITHGEVIVDRKSSFQGHVATVFSVDQVKQVLIKLKENRKIFHATHNIYAYRIYNESKKCFIHDCDDDGEHQAGSRLLHLLEIMNVKNVIVIVSRWYGGTHLGPNRFRHINNAARQVLAKANLLSN